MFNTISWQGYWVSIALLAAGYYLVIYLLYFRKDFSVQWNKNSNSNEGVFSSGNTDNESAQPATSSHLTLFHNLEEFQRPEKDSVESAVYACMDEVNAYLEAAKKSKCIKEEMLYALHVILKKYPAIATSEYKESLTNVLINQCEYLCSVHLSADDVVQVWVGG